MVAEIRKRQSGFSLIELIVVTSILMVVLYAGYFAYSLYSSKWQNRVEYFWNELDDSLAIESVYRILSATKKYAVRDPHGSLSHYLFIGNENEIVFISDASLKSKGPVLIKLTKVLENDFYRLVYQEANIEKRLILTSAQLEDEITWSKPSILMSNIDSISWQFYGWTTFESASLDSRSDGTSFLNVAKEDYQLHDPKIVRVLPERVQFVIKKSNDLTSFWVTLPNNTISQLMHNSRVDV